MSAYKLIKTEYRTLSSLLKAIDDMGYKPEVSKNPTDNSLQLIGYHGDIRPETASVRIDRFQISTVSNDVGFAWDGNCYNAIISDFDSSPSQAFTPANQGKLKQRYTVHEAKRLASLQGYSIQEQILSDGTINLICTSSGY